MQTSLLCSILAIAVSANFAVAANPDRSSDHESFNEQLGDAFQAEIQGSADVREKLLNSALSEDPKLRLARWHLGQIEIDGEWINFSELPQQLESDDALAKYRTIRGQYKNTSKDQLELANWCRSQGLVDREKAHLMVALERSENPNDPELRKRLGYRQVGGTWRTQAEIEAIRKSRLEYDKHLQYWQPKIQKLAVQFGSRRTAIRKRAEAELKAITAHEALPALEIVLGQAGLEAGRLLVEILGKFPSHQAADSLARLAVLSPWKVIREEATDQLHSRPYGAYVPELLSTLRTPVAAKVRLVVGSDGVHLLEQFSSETQTAHQVLDRNTSNYTRALGQRRFTLQGDGQDDASRLARARANATLAVQLKAAETQQVVDAQNRQTEAWNSRVCDVLANATGTRLPNEPAQWWEWWNDYNQMTDEEKEYQYSTYQETYVQDVSVRNPIRRPPRELPEPRPRNRPCECLVAGTPIWTDRGKVPVETVAVGDLVLTKNPETGELKYHPVQATTIRDAEPVMKVVTSTGSIRATGGHTFWISGHGWTKLRDVKPGQRFHGVSGPVEILSLEEDGEEKTYNLLVPKTHTYFTGEGLVLSHDVTVAEPVDAIIPGFIQP